MAILDVNVVGNDGSKIEEDAVFSLGDAACRVGGGSNLLSVMPSS